MKFVVSQISYLMKSSKTRRNIQLLWKFFLVLIVMIICYSILFHFLMIFEGREHSWITGFYWTMTVMSTLGFGDITFHSDIGKVFSIVVLVSGVVFLLILFPFSFIQFFYAPWIELQSKIRAPKEIPAGTRNHIILTGFDPVVESLVSRLNKFKRDYVIIIEELNKALELYDLGYKVAVGNVDDPATYHKMRVENAALVVAISNDELNTNIAYTVRELSNTVRIVTNATSKDSVDILYLAGSTQVLNLKEMLGQALARRSVVGAANSNIIGRIDDLLIAEAPIVGTPLVGKTLMESKLREKIGVNVIGIWERGEFQLASPSRVLSNTTVLVLAGTESQLQNYDEIFCIYNVTDSPVLILGYGKVGEATAAAMESRNIKYTIIEKNPSLQKKNPNIIIGNAADYEVLKKAGIEEAPSVIITTNDDATNIYITIYCRRLRPDIQIISRATLDRNISTLHRAGVDLVMSYSSLGANIIFNLLQKGEVLMLSEGLDVFRIQTPNTLSGVTIKESGIREKTNCSIVAISENGEMNFNPDPNFVLRTSSELILIGTAESETQFLKQFVS